MKDLTAQPLELTTQGLDVATSTGSSVRRLGAAGAAVTRRTVIFSVLLTGRRGIPRSLDARANLTALLERDRTGGQAAPAGAHSRSQEDAQLVLSGGVPRLWIMQLPHVGLSFSRIARHRRVTQCLGSMEGKVWLISVAPPGDSDDGARPRIEDIVAFRVPSNVIIKLHVGTWHAGPHVTGPGGLFINLEHADSNTNDHQSVDLGVECRYRVPQ